MTTFLYTTETWTTVSQRHIAPMPRVVHDIGAKARAPTYEHRRPCSTDDHVCQAPPAPTIPHQGGTPGPLSVCSRVASYHPMGGRAPRRHRVARMFARRQAPRPTWPLTPAHEQRRSAPLDRLRYHLPGRLETPHHGCSHHPVHRRGHASPAVATPSPSCLHFRGLDHQGRLPCTPLIASVASTSTFSRPSSAC